MADRGRGGGWLTTRCITMLGRRLRLAVIGGGPGSFIGDMHRSAARLDDRYELVASALSADPDRSRAAGTGLGLAEDRAYGSASRAHRGRGSAVGRSRRDLDHDSQRQPSRICSGGSRPWLRRDLRQADNQHAGRGSRPGEAGGADRSRLLSHPQLHGLLPGPSGEGDGRGRPGRRDQAGAGGVCPGRQSR